MRGSQELQKNSFYCSCMITQGIEKDDSSSIQSGLSLAYDLFVDYILEDRNDDLLTLGRDLNAAYLPFRERTDDPSAKNLSYLGQVRALINLCDYASDRLIPERVWKVVSKSKYNKPIMQAMLTKGILLAKDLCSYAGLRHATQVSRTVQPLISEGLLKRERFGKNVWYSLTSTGRLVASKYFGVENIDALRTILPATIIKLKQGWQETTDLYDSIRANIPNSSLRSIIGIVLSSLREAELAIEERGKWRIYPSPVETGQDLIDVSEHPEFTIASQLIEQEYNRLQIDKSIDNTVIDEAGRILDGIELGTLGDSSNQQALKVRISLEKAKCSALQRDWPTAFHLMGEGEEICSQLKEADLVSFESELAKVWSYLQVSCVDSQIADAKDLINRGDYIRGRDIFLDIIRILEGSRRWNISVSTLINTLTISIDMATEAIALQKQEYRHTLDDATNIDLTSQLREELYKSGQRENRRLVERVLAVNSPLI